MMHAHEFRRRAAPRGFTLLEIIIVVGLIAALAGALIAGLAGVQGGGQVAIVEQYVATGVKAPLMTYRLNVGSFPTTAQGLNALRDAPAGVGNKWRGPYLDKDPIDPWGQSYNYRYPSTHNSNFPDIWSNGPNGQNEEGGGDDIPNW